MKWLSLKNQTLIVENNFRCLGLYKNDFVIFMQYKDGHWYTCGYPGTASHCMDNIFISEISHWMPLPLPPKDNDL